MKEQESMDAESAYGSEISSNYSFLMKKDTFTTEEPTPTNQIGRTKTRGQLLKYKLREYMVLEVVFFLILIFLLITCYRITSQNQETQRMILSIQSQLNSFQNKSNGKDFTNTKDENGKMNGDEAGKQTTLEEDLKEVQMKWEEELKAIESMINSTEKSKKTHAQPTIPNVSLAKQSIAKQFNAASLIADATIDKSLSSSSSLNPLIGFDQSSLVLVDRPEPPADKAWCTSDKNPVLTVDLGYYINPTAVSYQHSKWNGVIPDDAPKEYSVESCLDEHCRKRKPLFSQCGYTQHGLQEQICNNVSNDSINSPVGKVQFHFHKNHGNTERTCVSLVRVYSETELVPEQKFRGLEDTTTCLDLNHHYHNNPIRYKYFSFKNCTVLYSKGCCQECPECCEECEVKDINPERMRKTSIIVLAVFFYIFFMCMLVRNRRRL